MSLPAVPPPTTTCVKVLCAKNVGSVVTVRALVLTTIQVNSIHANTPEGDEGDEGDENEQRLLIVAKMEAEENLRCCSSASRPMHNE